MTKTYTFTECYALLDVDPKTFRRWLEKAGIDPEHQVSKIDNRIRFLTQEQVDLLARDHGRTLRPIETRPSTEIIPASAYKLLLDRAEDLERQAQRLTEQVALHSENLGEQGETLNGLTADVFRIEGNLGEQIDELRRLLSDVLLRNDRLEQLVGEQSAQIAALQQQRPMPRKAREPVDSSTGLPAGLIAWRTFANLHKCSQTTTGRYVAQGYISVVKGKWKVGNGYVKEALDAQGRRDFWVQFHATSGFTPCADCPHNQTGQ